MSIICNFRLQHWDVNNEMTNNKFYADSYGSYSIRNDMFRKARSADPGVKLFLNDYNILNRGSNLKVGTWKAQLIFSIMNFTCIWLFYFIFQTVSEGLFIFKLMPK